MSQSLPFSPSRMPSGLQVSGALYAHSHCPSDEDVHRQRPVRHPDGSHLLSLTVQNQFRYLYRLCDERVDVVELGLTDIDVDTAEDVDRCCDCLPVERYIVGDVEIQILIQGFYGLFRTTIAYAALILLYVFLSLTFR